ncbi:MAG: hypothetical protein GYA42_02140 [Syntrophomonadaceae bacterium]|nr:hypothetical protein [Syntrophomonadaceae bacterium]
MEKKGYSFTGFALTAICAAIVAAWGAYSISQHNYQSRLAALSVEADQLQTQVKSLEQRLEREQVKPSPVAGRELRSVIQAEGDEILTALKSRDAATLARYVHPQQGLRFTPYSYIDLEKDLVFSVADIPTLFSSDRLYTWGSYDGSGEPIALNFDNYYAKFVYDQNFLAAPQTVFNQVIQRGNTINNFTSAYPRAVSLEYHFAGFDPQYEGMDWKSLKLAFEPVGDTWYLVGIIHEQWTI